MRAPLKPLAPADDQLITSPAVSVMETMVLLKVLWMCATPLGTLRLAFLGPVFLAGLAMGGELRVADGDRWGRKGNGENAPETGKRYFFLPATVFRAPRRVRALVRVR